MAHYVLMFRGESPQQTDIDLIERSSGVTVLDRVAAQALLVDAPDDVVRELREKLPNWVVANEVSYPPPGPETESVREDDPG